MATSLSIRSTPTLFTERVYLAPIDDSAKLRISLPEPVRRGEYRYDRTLPVVFSPLNPHELFFSANVLFKTENAGKSWTVISPDLSRESYQTPANLGVFATADPEKGKHRGVIYAVAPSFNEANTIWAGTDDGLIHITRDAGKTWQNVTPPQLTPWSKVSIIEAGHFDAGTAYAAINTFRLDDLHPHIYRTRDYGKNWAEITRGLADNAPINVVREDPARKGLLFAGSETSVYVSFDDGDYWQPLQMNLPHASMRDLAIHGDDLIVATHGRSFWILDDITPLRQWTSQSARASTRLFAPQSAVRFRWNRNTDTPLPPEVPAGQNPPDGAIIDYLLTDGSHGEVKLEIFDAQNHLVRRYSSADQPKPMEKIAAENPIPMYWVRPQQVLSSEAGFHRFVWDLHCAPPDSLNHEFPISAIYLNTPELPLGAMALPGRYVVKLTVDEKSQEQPLMLHMDPRIKTPVAELRAQFEMETGSVRGMNESFKSLGQVQSVGEQLAELSASSGNSPLSGPISSVKKKLAQLEGSAESNFFGVPASGKRPENFSTLNQHFGNLLAVADSADSAPTSQAQSAYREEVEGLKNLETQWAAIRDKDIAQLNVELVKAGKQPIDPDKPASSQATNNGDGDDEP